MTVLSRWFLLVCFAYLHAYGSRIRDINAPELFSELTETEESLGDISCSSRTCLKRSTGQDELGPFWANRGKKNSRYIQQYKFMEDPRSVRSFRTQFRPDFNTLILRAGNRVDDLTEDNFWRVLNDIVRVRDRRFSTKRLDIDSPFFAARGKKFNEIE